VADDLRALSERRLASMDLEYYRSKVLTPKELGGGLLENAAKGAGKTTIRKTVTGGEPVVGNPMSEEFISEIGQKFGAIEEDFKRRYRQARALLKSEGKPSSPPEAWAKVVSENYVRSDTLFMLTSLMNGQSYLGNKCLMIMFLRFMVDMRVSLMLLTHLVGHSSLMVCWSTLLK